MIVNRAEPTTQSDTPPTDQGKRRSRFFVVSLADERAGVRHGCWIDGDQPVHAMRAEISAMLQRSEQPEASGWAIREYDGFEGLRAEQDDFLRQLGEAARGIAKYGEIFPVLVEHLGGIGRVDEAHRLLHTCYGGAHHSIGAYAEAFYGFYYDELYELPSVVRESIDFERVGATLLERRDIYTLVAGGQLHVFARELPTAHLPTA